MQEPKDIFNTRKKEGKKPLFVDLTSYFTQELDTIPEDYLMAEKFAKINPILEMAQREVILDENLLEKKSEEKQLQITPNKMEQKIQEFGNSDILKQKGLEHTLLTQSPIIVVLNNPASYNSYENQNHGTLNYKQFSRSNYHRQFAWYDIPKQNIIVPMYYKRH